MFSQISFVEALPIIGILLFFVYLAILITKPKKGDSEKSLHGIRWICFTLAIILLYILAISPMYSSRPPYFFIVFSITACFVLFILILPIRLSKMDTRAIFSLILLLQLSITISYSLSSGIVIGERTSAIHEIVAQGRWFSETSLVNAYYQTFPIDVGLIAIISQITSIDYTSPILHIAMSVASSLVFMLTLFKLVTLLRGDSKEGILAMLIFTTIPVLGPIGINPPYLSLLFLTLTLYLLVKYVRSIKSNVRTPTLSVLLTVVTVSVMTHAISPVTLMFMLILLFLITRIGLAREESWMKPFNRILGIATLISLTIWMFTEAWPVIMAYGRSIANGLFREIFGYEAGKNGYRPLYGENVPAYFAYAWATPIAIAAALMFREMLSRSSFRLTKKIDILLLFNLTGLSLVLTGFLVTFVYPEAGIQVRLALPAFLLSVPAISRALKLVSKKSIFLAIILLCLVMPSIPISMINPNKAPDAWEFMVSSGGATMQDQLEASVLVPMLKNNTHIIGTSSLMYAIGLQTYKEKLSLQGLQSLKDVRNVIDALIANKETFYKGLIITGSENLPLKPNIDIVYSSGRNLAYLIR